MKAKPKPERETVELVTGDVFYSDDNWVTVWRRDPHGQVRAVGPTRADHIRYLALVKYGGGRDDEPAGKR